jgi:hypothetical protein
MNETDFGSIVAVRLQLQNSPGEKNENYCSCSPEQKTGFNHAVVSTGKVDETQTQHTFTRAISSKNACVTHGTARCPNGAISIHRTLITELWPNFPVLQLFSLVVSSIEAHLAPPPSSQVHHLQPHLHTRPKMFQSALEPTYVLRCIRGSKQVPLKSKAPVPLPLSLVGQHHRNSDPSPCPGPVS